MVIADARDLILMQSSMRLLNIGAGHATGVGSNPCPAIALPPIQAGRDAEHNFFHHNPTPHPLHAPHPILVIRGLADRVLDYFNTRCYLTSLTFPIQRVQYGGSIPPKPIGVQDCFALDLHTTPSFPSARLFDYLLQRRAKSSRSSCSGGRGDSDYSRKRDTPIRLVYHHRGRATDGPPRSSNYNEKKRCGTSIAPVAGSAPTSYGCGVGGLSVLEKIRVSGAAG